MTEAFSSRNTVQCFATHNVTTKPQHTPAKETEIGRQRMAQWDRFVESLRASDSWSSHQGCVHRCAGLQPCLYSRTEPTLTFLQVSCPCSCKHQGHKILLITLQLLRKWVWLAKGGHTASALMTRQLILVKPYRGHLFHVTSRIPKMDQSICSPLYVSMECCTRKYGLLLTRASLRSLCDRDA